ncbi:MAG: lamin tail domain-containing protein, partial [Calditrichaeota bacterium]|nr:lamin tail domain-containing protein [Calditrichota bacterium]
MKNRVFQIFVVFTLGISTGCIAQIVLSEIMFNPAGNERYNEFVEIYNADESDTIDLACWLLSDGTKMNEIIAHEQGTRLAPNQFALIFVPKYFTESRQYDAVIPADVLILTIGNSQFGAYGFSNNRSETVSILMPDSTTVASWGYRVKNPDGISEEKRVLDRGDFDGNWGNALVSGGTPGFLNSITPFEFDMTISGDDISVRPGCPSRKDSITISFWLKNIGSKIIPEFEILIYDNDELVFQRQIEPDHFAWLDSVHEEIILPPFPIGDNELLIRADFTDDQDLSNNEATVHFSVQPAPGDVVINEIYSRPPGVQGQWIELKNRSGELLDLTNWRIKSTLSQMTLPQIVLNPGSMVVLSQFGDVRDFFWQTKTVVTDIGDDFLQIDAISDTLVLWNENGATIDSTFYRIETGIQGKSLERRQPVAYPPKAAVWGFCTHPLGGTPGEENAIGRYFVDVALRSDSTRIQFEKPHAGQDITFTTEIHNWGNLQADDIQISLLEISGN